MTACPTNAIATDRATGAKLVIDQLCIGCHLCTIACPFGTVFTLPESDKASKCHLCGGAPACATSCPTDAIEYVEADQSWFGPWAAKVTENYVNAVGG